MAKYLDQARRIRRYQDDLNLPEDKQYAEYLGLKQPNVSNIVRGERLGLESLMQICEKVNGDPWWVWCGEGEPYRKNPDEPLTLNEIWAKAERLEIEERLELAMRILESFSPQELGRL